MSWRSSGDSTVSLMGFLRNSSWQWPLFLIPKIGRADRHVLVDGLLDGRDVEPRVGAVGLRALHPTALQPLHGALGDGVDGASWHDAAAGDRRRASLLVDPKT